MGLEADDRELTARLASGEAAAWGELYDRFGERLYRAATRLCGRSSDAEDVVQELFVALVRARERLRQVDQLTAYLFTGLRRQVIDHARRRAATVEGRVAAAVGGPQSLDDAAAVLASIASEAERSDDVRERLDAALSRLPGEQREVVVMKIDGELTFAQIAEVLDISPNTAASRYRYALEKLKELLDDGG